MKRITFNLAWKVSILCDRVFGNDVRFGLQLSSHFAPSPQYKGVWPVSKLFDRFKEPSTWRGLAIFTTAFGVGISPEMMGQTIVAGTAITGLIGMMTADIG